MMRTAPESGWLGKIVAALAGAVLLVLGIMFSLVLLVAIAVVGLLAWGYFWWKTRALRKAMREQSPTGQVIEGEASVVEEYEMNDRPALPDETDKR